MTITLNPKGRATFVDVSYCEDGAFQRAQLPESAFTGEKLGYEDKLDLISYVNGISRDNEKSPVVEPQVEVEDKLSWFLLRRSTSSWKRSVSPSVYGEIPQLLMPILLSLPKTFYPRLPKGSFLSLK